MFLVFAELGSASEKLKSEGYVGAFVTAVVPADDIRTAIDLGERALLADGYEVIDIDKVLRFDPEEWGHDEEVTAAATESAIDQELRYTTFNVWGH